MNDYHKKAEAVLQQVNQVILGKEQETAEIFLAFLADGHVLLEDISERQPWHLVLPAPWIWNAAVFSLRRMSFLPI